MQWEMAFDPLTKVKGSTWQSFPSLKFHPHDLSAPQIQQAPFYLRTVAHVPFASSSSDSSHSWLSHSGFSSNSSRP